MDLNDDAVAALLGQLLQMTGNLATAMNRAGLLIPNEQGNLHVSMKEVAHLLEVFAGDELPPGLAAELQARANDIGLPPGLRERE